MIKKTFIVGCEQGFHMRPAQVLMETATQFQSDINIIREDDETNAKSILGLMSLGLEKGSEYEEQIDGPDEGKAMEAVQALFDSNFGE